MNNNVLSRCPKSSRDRQKQTLRPNPFDWKSVFCVAKHDLFGTKDVQDAITASYVWLADQLGHFTLGFVPTLFTGWIYSQLWKLMSGPLRLPAIGLPIGTIFVGFAIWAIWIKKEREDYRESKANASHGTPPAGRKFFPFDEFDLIWNVVTALLFFGIGGACAVAAMLADSTGSALGIPALAACAINLAFTLTLTGILAVPVMLWWLRRKMAFQQADLPYLYRLANFPRGFRPADLLSLLFITSSPEDAQQKQMYDLLVLRWIRSRIRKRNDPAFVMNELNRQGIKSHRHLIITGPLHSGKSSLAIGIGTEFAFVKGIGRYLTFTKLLQFLERSSGQNPSTFEFDSGRVLWPLGRAELLVVDDVDAGLTAPATKSVRPENIGRLIQNITHSRTSLHWLKTRRSVWVLGKVSAQDDIKKWQDALALILNVSPGDIGILRLNER